MVCFNSLRELILLEEFKKCTPDRCVVYLNEQKVVLLNDAAVFADEFVLTHKSVFVSCGKPSEATNQEASSARFPPQ